MNMMKSQHVRVLWRLAQDWPLAANQILQNASAFAGSGVAVHALQQNTRLTQAEVQIQRRVHARSNGSVAKTPAW